MHYDLSCWHRLHTSDVISGEFLDFRCELSLFCPLLNTRLLSTSATQSVIYKVVAAVDARHYVTPGADRPPVAAKGSGRVYSTALPIREIS
jgi:hypothetical protein